MWESPLQSPWGPLDNLPNSSGTSSWLGSANSLRPQLPLPTIQAKPETPNLWTALLYAPTLTLLCHLPTCQPVLPPSQPHLTSAQPPYPMDTADLQLQPLCCWLSWVSILTVDKSQLWGYRSVSPISHMTHQLTKCKRTKNQWVELMSE